MHADPIPVSRSVSGGINQVRYGAVRSASRNTESNVRSANPVNIARNANRNF